jgi:hypothetical protein
MKRLLALFGLVFLGSLTVFAFGQWQVQPQIDPRVGPIYPVNPSYNFNSRSNYDPFQFNWASGRWDYMPFPGGSSSGSSTGPHNQSPYIYSPPQPANPPPAAAPAPPSNPTPPTPDDSEFWSAPTTQPQKVVAPRIVQFEGRIIAVKAVDFAGEPYPHLLLRLRNNAGANGTIDAGQRLELPDTAFDPSVKGYVTATGQLGVLDGRMLLFANQVTFGSKTIAIERPGDDAPK